tara:strand:- start:74274 stop:74420 length:147 start_codon:yes stop_codon:yes gene_type:complete
MSDENTCPACEGEGWMWIWTCDVCGGDGKTRKSDDGDKTDKFDMEVTD